MNNSNSFSLRFKKVIRFLATLFASREFAVFYCVLGTVAEIAHMYFLAYSISALSGVWKIAQAVMLATFISSSLLYFVLISDDRDTSERGKKDAKRVNLAINIFTIIAIAINFYYYARHLIIDSTNWQIFDFIFAIIVSCLLPVTIKLYANGIHVRDWDSDEISNQDLTNINKIIEETVAKQFDELNLPNKEEIKQAFQENSQLFLQQFENKCKLMIDKNLKNIPQEIKTEPIINENSPE